MPVMAQPAKVTEPPVAALGLAVQANVPPGLVPMARVIELVAVVTTLPPTSSTATVGWVAHAAVLAPPPGWVVKTSLVAVPAVMLNGVLVAVVEPGRGRGERCS